MKYFEFGQEKETLMVLLHGGGVCYRGVLPVAERLAKDFHVIVVAYDMSRGFVVAGEDTKGFLEETLSPMGLTDKEANEFIIYWLPQMKGNEYNLISFQHEVYRNSAELTIEPAPDSILRVFMAWKPLNEPIDIEPQGFVPFEREGFAVVEWGGVKVN